MFFFAMSKLEKLLFLSWGWFLQWRHFSAYDWFKYNREADVVSDMWRAYIGLEKGF